MCVYIYIAHIYIYIAFNGAQSAICILFDKVSIKYQAILTAMQQEI